MRTMCGDKKLSVVLISALPIELGRSRKFSPRLNEGIKKHKRKRKKKMSVAETSTLASYKV